MYVSMYEHMYVCMAGSGPAYVFLTMEAMIDAAVHMGFPRETAKKLVLSTIRGSASYAQVGVLWYFQIVIYHHDGQ